MIVRPVRRFGRWSEAFPTIPETQESNEASQVDEGPGCMPAVLAATALMGIVGFIFCAFSAWFLFQKRTDLAVRTLQGSFIPQLEQSYLEPATKAAVVAEVEAVVKDLQRGRYENEQAGNIMLRLQRLPMLPWGELQAVEAYLEAKSDDEESVRDGLRQISRLKRGVELGEITSFDFEDLLQSVRRVDAGSPTGSSLKQPLADEMVKDVIDRARLLADRAEVPDQSFDVQLESIVSREIEEAAAGAGF